MTDAWASLLILARTATFIALFPPWAGRALPQTVKVGMSIALTVFWATGLDVVPRTIPEGWLGIAIETIREAIVGAVLAQVVGLVLIPPKIAGSYIAQEMGLTFAALASPIDQHPTDSVAQIFESLALALFFVLDGHHFVFRVLNASWRAAPCGSAWPAPLWARCALAATGTVESGLAIAASIGVIMLVVTVWLSLAARMAPQMHLFAWGMSARVLIGLIAMVAYLPELVLACGRSVLDRQAAYLFQ